MCGRACAHAGVECVGMCVCVCSSEPGGSEGGVKCYSFSYFHVTEKCLCQTLQRRERGCSAKGSYQVVNVRMKREADMKQELGKVSSPPLHHCLMPACSLPVFFPPRYNLQPEAA